MLITSLILSCTDDDFAKITEETLTGTGLTEITLSSFTVTPSADEDGIEDGTYIIVKPLAIGVDYYEVDFGDPNSTSDVITITDIAFRGTATYDYPNEVEEVDYTITVTAKSNKGLADVVMTEDITVTHSVTSIDSAPSSPRDACRSGPWATREVLF